jgi:hypothetical protein
MPHTYNEKPFDPDYIPSPRRGRMWLENSDRPLPDLALLEYTGYGLDSRELEVTEFRPGGKIRQAIWLRIK